MSETIRDYRVLGRIGKGGMATVYLATHIHLDLKVALKVLNEEYSDNASIRGRFLNEAKLLGTLKHSNIVHLNEFFQENGRFVLVMEYVDGRSLDDMIGREVGPIPVEKAIPLFTQILDGISYAHGQGVLHRDIKPANILVSRNGEVKIADLGIAKVAGSKGMTKTGTKIGTVYYMSPEQVRGQEADFRSDIYSLGMTLYETLAGCLPFGGEAETSEFAVMAKIVNGEFPDPREFYPHIPEWAVSAVRKATSSDPNYRFQNCDEFNEYLKNNSGSLAIESSYWKSQVSSLGKRELIQGQPFATTPGASGMTQSENACQSCGSPITAEMEYCSDCGTSLNEACPKCNKPVRKGKRFCPSCGTELSIDDSSDTAVMNKVEKADRVTSLPAGMEFVSIPSGSFQMGSPSSEGGRETDEARHSVAVKSFELMTTEVTQGMWKEVMGSNPANGYGVGDNYPVYNVSWDDCQGFINRLNDIDPSHEYRLPSEAEWEYACRAGTTTRFYWGDSDSESTMGMYCWYDVNSNGSTHPVGTKQPNAWGLYDISGNVWEWCEDVYTIHYADCPTNGSAYTGSGSCRVFRGGGWGNDAGVCRSANRNGGTPGGRDFGLGFRVARSVS